jgi:hypothetical protein
MGRGRARAGVDEFTESMLLALLKFKPFDRAGQLLRMEKLLGHFQRFRKRYYKMIWNMDRIAGIKTANGTLCHLLCIQIHFPANRHMPRMALFGEIVYRGKISFHHDRKGGMIAFIGPQPEFVFLVLESYSKQLLKLCNGVHAMSAAKIFDFHGFTLWLSEPMVEHYFDRSRLAAFIAERRCSGRARRPGARDPGAWRSRSPRVISRRSPAVGPEDPLAVSEARPARSVERGRTAGAHP